MKPRPDDPTANFTLGRTADLHATFQLALGWNDEHLNGAAPAEGDVLSELDPREIEEVVHH